MKVFRTLSICTVLLFLVAPAGALNPDRDIHQLAHRSWGEKDGYPGKTEALAQTADGFLWIGSDNGLFRFDGVHFERYVPRSGDKLSEGPVRGLLALPDGSLWIAYRLENKICVLRNGNVKSYGKANGVTSNPTTIVQDHEGTIWANTETGVIRFNGARWEHIGRDWNFPEDVPHITSDVLFVDSRGTLWAGVNHTILYLKQGSKRFEPTGAFAGWSASIAEAPDGTIWLSDNLSYVRAISTSVSAKSAAMAKCEVETPKGVPAKCPSEGPLVVKISAAVRLLFDRNGSLWMTTDTSGVGRVPHPELLRDRPISKTSDALQRFSSKGGLSADTCTPILEDREGNIWVATRDGLDQFRDTALVPVTLPTSLIRVAIAPADGGDIWVAGTWNYVARIHGDSRDRDLSLVPADAFKPYRDPAGVTWLLGDSLGKWKDGRFRTVAQSPDGFATGPGTWQVAGDRFGTLWAFSNGHGFFSLDHRRWKTWATPPEVVKQHVANMYSDSTGRIWVSTYESDIITMDKGDIVDYPVTPDRTIGLAKAFAEHAPQEIWAGGAGGLVLIDRGHFRPIKPAALDSLEDVTGIVDAGSEGLWINASGGVIHIPRDEAGRALRDPSYRFHWERFDSSDGLPGQTEKIYPYPKAIQGTDGRIWFTATRGVAWVDPKNIPRNAVPPPVSITSVSADGSRYPRLTDLRLPAHTANVQIDYSALSLSAPERVRFRYKLEGHDADWQDVGNRRQAFYNDLAPRNYRFRVMACNNSGVWNEAGTFIDFSIAPAYYQTNWFRALCVAAFLAVLWVLYQLRIQQVRRQERKLRDVIETIPTFAWTALPDGYVDFVNRHWQEYTGLSSEKTLRSGWEAVVHPQDLKCQAEKWRASVATGAPFESEVRYRRAADGQYRWFLTRAVPLRDERGKIAKWYGSSTDIEDRKRAEQLQADLAHINRVNTMGELTASLAHEIKQPIGATVMNADTCLRWLASDQPDLDEIRQAASSIVKDGKRAADVIDRIRSLYKKAPPQRQLVDVNEIIGEIVVLLRGEANRYAVSMRTDLAADLPKITADRVQLQQLFMNLMLNGIEAMKETGGVLMVKSQLGQDGVLLISASDTGVGLPAEKVDQIFNAFFTTKPQGSGMGLAISRSIVESHGGRLWATANSGRGATFHFTLPTTTEVLQEAATGT